MNNLYFKDVFGNAAAIIEKNDGTYRLIMKDKFGRKLKDQNYKKLRGAKTALGMAGPWIERKTTAIPLALDGGLR